MNKNTFKLTGFTDKAPYVALFLLKTLTPILAVIFVLSFITLSTNKICTYEILDIIFSVDIRGDTQLQIDEKRNSKKYQAAEEFIKSGKRVVYYVADKSINFMIFFLKDMMKDHEFGMIDFDKIEMEHIGQCNRCKLNIGGIEPDIKPKLCLNR
tara:strand:+ start:8910 stop:9371 length:462 start_codon:yes stop_codon:yes gene_type:complete